MKGYLITFEGIDGSGKTTQAELLYRHFLDCGYIVRLLREPGGTIIGEKIRSILLDASLSEMMPYSELFLYLAARVQISAQCIAPSLEKGEIVIMDRFCDSSTAYQGFARGLGVDVVEHLNSIATGGLIPDITFYIDCDSEIALGRVESKPDRLESEGLKFMECVREGFLLLCKSNKDRFVLIDGEQPAEKINVKIIREIKNRFDINL